MDKLVIIFNSTENHIFMRFCRISGQRKLSCFYLEVRKEWNDTGEDTGQ